MSTNFLEEIKPYNVRKKIPRSHKCALLVIDMQEFFRPIAHPIINNVVSTIDAFRAKDMKVIFTRHGHKDLSKDGGMLYEWWGDLVMYGTKEWQFLQEISPLDSELIVDKMRYSAFYGTDLERDLRTSGVEELIIAGVMTNCCCETTARDGFMRDFRIFVLSDATATASRELHLASLKNLAYAFAHVVSTHELIKYL